MFKKQMFIAIYSIFIVLNFVNLTLSAEERLHKDVFYMTPIKSCNRSDINVEDLRLKPIGLGDWIFEGTVTFQKEIKEISRLVIELEKCRSKSESETCEKTTPVRVRNICPMITMKGQIWSTIIEKVQPPFKCPLKGTYNYTGGYIDVEMVKKFTPYVKGWYWKSTINTYDENDLWRACYNFGYSIIQVNIRNRERKA